jgi:hypothetical protein
VLVTTFALATAFPVGADAATTTTVTVTNGDLTTSTPTAAGQFQVIDQSGTAHGGAVNVVGPAAPPLGIGSLRLNVTTTADHWSVYNYDHIGLKLGDITALSYSTLTDNPTTAPALQMEINPGASTSSDYPSGVTYSTVNFEPYFAQSPQAGQWQSWDVLHQGSVWGSHLNMGQGPGLPWRQFLMIYPSAQIIGGFGVNVGSGWAAMTGNADALAIGTATGTTVYDFEPYHVAQNKDDCKDGGWQFLADANDNPFKNQGQCVSYAATGGKH